MTENGQIQNTNDQVLRIDEKVISWIDKNQESWHQILDRAIDIYDSEANIAIFSKKLIALLLLQLKRK